MGTDKARDGGVTRGALMIALLYGAIGGLWIVLSDQVAEAIAPGNGSSVLVQTIKGLAYIGVTSGVLFWLVKRHSARLRAAQQAAIESGARYQRLLDESPVAILTVSGARVMYSNRAAAEMLQGGLTTGLTNRPLADFVGEEHLSQVEEAGREALASGEAVRLEGVGMIGPEAGELTTELTIGPSPGGGPGTVQIAIIDVSKRRALERQMASMQRLEAVGQLAAGITHDFNNVLTAIFGQVHLLRRLVEGSNKANEALDQVTQAAKQAEAITRGLLAFARPAAPERRVVRLGEIVSKTAELIRPALSAAITLRVDADAPSLVSVDPIQIQQVLMNLMINARDAMPGGGTLSVRVWEDRGADEVRFEVSDTGEGMTPEVLARLYDPFFTTKPAGQGTGLGLPVAKRIIENHGGRIDVVSEQGKGATFAVSLPRVPEEGEADETHAKAIPAVRAGVTAILGEDNPHVRAVLRSSLHDMGINVLEARDGEELLRVYRRSDVRPHLLVLDMEMPGVSGAECLREIRAADPYLPVLICSGSVDEPPEAPGEGRVAFVRKPFDVPALQRVVAELLNGAAAKA